MDDNIFFYIHLYIQEILFWAALLYGKIWNNPKIKGITLFCSDYFTENAYWEPCNNVKSVANLPLNPNQKTPCHKWSHNHLCSWVAGAGFMRFKRGHARVHLVDREWRQHWNWSIKLLKFSSSLFQSITGWLFFSPFCQIIVHCNPTVKVDCVNLLCLSGAFHFYGPLLSF